MLTEKERQFNKRLAEVSGDLTSRLLNESWKIHKSFAKRKLFVEPQLIFSSVYGIASNVTGEKDE